MLRQPVTCGNTHGRFETDDGEPMTIDSLGDAHSAGAWRMPDGPGHAQGSGRGDYGDYGGGYGGGVHASGEHGRLRSGIRCGRVCDDDVRVVGESEE